MRMSEDRARIPLGVMQELWTIHLKWINREDRSDSKCAVCGLTHSTCADPLLICDGTKEVVCTRVQHLLCSGLTVPEEAPEVWRCGLCDARVRLGL